MKNYWLKPQLQLVSGYPSDDALTIQQMAGSSCNLDFWYNSQFVQNEVLEPLYPLEKRDNLRMLNTPVLAGTMTGTIYLKTQAIQTFLMTSSGNHELQDICHSKVKVTSIRLNLQTGEISFVWNEKPGDHRYVVSYEYNIECGFDPNQ